MQIPASSNGHLVLLTGPSGSGKNTLKAHIQDVFGDALNYIVSYTTRAKRPGEIEGQTYHYVSRDAFERMIDDGAFIEWASYSGNYYGIPRAEVERGLQQGEILFREIELQGYLQIKKQLPRSRYTLIFIDGGSWDTLVRRITARAPIPEHELAARRASYDAEVKVRDEADAVIVNEDGKVDAAKADIEAFVRRFV